MKQIKGTYWWREYIGEENDEEFDTSNLFRIRNETDDAWEITWIRLNGRLLRTYEDEDEDEDEDNVVEDN